MPNSEMQLDIEEAVMQLYPGDDARKAALRHLLAAEPSHLRKLKLLLGRPAAAEAYVTKVLPQASTMPRSGDIMTPETPMTLSDFLDGRQVEDALGSSSATARIEVGHRTTAEEMEIEDHLGTYRQVAGQLELRQEDAWVVVNSDVAEAVRKSLPVIAGAAAATAAHFASRSGEAMAAASVATTAASASRFTETFAGGASVLAGVLQPGGPAVQSVHDMILQTSQAQVAQAHVLTEQAQVLTGQAVVACHVGSVLVVGCMGYQLYDVVRRYYKGQIDGWRCAEDITTFLASSAACYVAGSLAAAAVAGAGPAGVAVVALMGAYLAAGGTEVLARHLFATYFGDERSRAVDRAYATLELRKGARPHDVRRAYLELARRFHPDRQPNGAHSKFIEVNCAYELIRASLLAA